MDRNHFAWIQRVAFDFWGNHEISSTKEKTFYCCKIFFSDAEGENTFKPPYSIRSAWTLMCTIFLYNVHRFESDKSCRNCSSWRRWNNQKHDVMHGTKVDLFHSACLLSKISLSLLVVNIYLCFELCKNWKCVNRPIFFGARKISLWPENANKDNDTPNTCMRGLFAQHNRFSFF